ncbi:MAG: ASPIC/UnbV domain-containing protein, partial [Saprospiraceae bacterium]
GVNTSAVGAMALLYGDQGIQVREVRAGEQYGVSNSHNIIFGMGSSTTYDSLIIRWPDGTRESFNNLMTDQIWTLYRGGCARTSDKVWQPLKAICGDDSLGLALHGTNNITWSTGSVNDSISVHDPGLYFATYMDDINCPVKTQPIEVITNPDSLKPTINYEGKNQFCHGDGVLLSLPIGSDYTWSTGEHAQSIVATSTGNYYASVQGYCKEQFSDTVALNFLVPPTPETVGDTFSIGEQATLIAAGDSIVWYSDSDGMNVIGRGSPIILDGLNDNLTVYAQNLDPIPGQDYQVGPPTQQGTPRYNGTFINGGLQFEVLEPILLNQLTVFTDSVGARIIEITNGAGFFFDKQVDLLPGTTVVQMEVEIPIGNYTIGTNTDLNTLVFGVSNPYLWRSSEGVQFPYLIDGVISINNSTYGTQFYYYFYDWKVSTSDKYCGSDLAPVTAVLDLNVATGSVEEDQALIITPNPTSGMSYLFVKSSSQVNLEVTNTSGKMLYAKKETPVNGEATIDFSSYPSGVYFVRMIQDGKMHTRKVLKL